PSLRARRLEARAPHGVETPDRVRGRHPAHGRVVPGERGLVASDQAGRVPCLLRAHVRSAQGAEGGAGVRSRARPRTTVWVGLALAWSWSGAAAQSMGDLGPPPATSAPTGGS